MLSCNDCDPNSLVHCKLCDNALILTLILTVIGIASGGFGRGFNATCPPEVFQFVCVYIYMHAYKSAKVWRYWTPLTLSRKYPLHCTFWCFADLIKIFSAVSGRILQYPVQLQSSIHYHFLDIVSCRMLDTDLDTR